MATRCVCVLLDFFITTIELLDRPDLRGQPVLVAGDPKKRGLVIAASPEALAFGVTPGMPAWEALHRCPQAAVLPPRPDLYNNKADMVLNILSLYSDQVEHSQLDRFYLTMTDLGDTGAGDIVGDMQRQVTEQTGLSLSIGVAANKLVAHAAARSGIAGGLVVVQPGQEAAFMAPLPLEWLASDEKMHAQLARLGLRTIGDLAAAPQDMLAAHVGSAGKMLLRHAQGKDGRAVRSTQERTAVEWEHAFSRVVNDRESLRRWVVYLVARTGQDLRARKLQARTLTLTIGHLENAPTVFVATLPKATDVDSILRRMALHLFGAWDGRAGVASIGVEAGVLSAESNFQLTLFDEQENAWEEQQRRLDQTNNGLNRRYGQGTVMAAMLLDDDILAAMGKKPKKK